MSLCDHNHMERQFFLFGLFSLLFCKRCYRPFTEDGFKRHVKGMKSWSIDG